MEKRLNTGWSKPVPSRGRNASAIDSIKGLLGFVLSAVMAIGFVALVNKTHDLLSHGQFYEQAAACEDTSISLEATLPHFVQRHNAK